jgi:hypothetical protein
MAFVSDTQVIALETQSALIASILLAVACTIIEAVFAHTFSQTIGNMVATQLTVVIGGGDSETSRDLETSGAEGRYNALGWGGRKTVLKTGHNTAYTLIQSVHDQSHETTPSKPISSRRLDTANFLQALHSYK